MRVLGFPFERFELFQIRQLNWFMSLLAAHVTILS
jgi:hypothetical protein